MACGILQNTQGHWYIRVDQDLCIDELQETPFLVDTEKCEDVPKIVCTEVRCSFSIGNPMPCFQIEEQVPIQVCKTIDKQRTPIVVGKGRWVTVAHLIDPLWVTVTHCGYEIQSSISSNGALESPKLIELYSL